MIDARDIKTIIGIDPDSEKHGVAVYRDFKLVALQELPLMPLIDLIQDEKDSGLIVSIENVMSNKFIYRRNQRGNSAVQSKIAISVGRNMQSQVELVRALDGIGVLYELHPPGARNWAQRKPVFIKATSWTGRSNNDTRSAAYFGYLAVTRIKAFSKAAK